MPKKTFSGLVPQKQEEILDRALDVFLEHSGEISTVELIQALDMPTGTFYRYFEDKEDLMTAVLVNDKLSFDTKVSFVQEPSDVAINEHIRKRNRLFHSMTDEVLRKYYFGENKDRLLVHYRRELKRLKYAGLLREDVDIDLVAYMYATSLFNFEMYCREFDYGDDLAFKWKMKKYFYYSFFKFGIMKTEENCDE
jgi:AcrR family transcriptional regulator